MNLASASEVYAGKTAELHKSKSRNKHLPQKHLMLPCSASASNHYYVNDRQCELDRESLVNAAFLGASIN